METSYQSSQFSFYECSFVWELENFPQAAELSDTGRNVSSKTFGCPKTPGIVWSLLLYPAGENKEAEGHASLFLQLEKCPRPELRATYKLEIGEVTYTDKGREFKLTGKQSNWGWNKFIALEETKKTSTLTIKATVEYEWTGGDTGITGSGDIATKQFSVFPIYQCKMEWEIDNFEKVADLSAVGRKIESENFCHSGTPQIQWQLRLYPVGDSEESSGNVSLYLMPAKCPRREPKVKTKFTIGNKQISFLHKVPNTGWGFAKAMTLEDSKAFSKLVVTATVAYEWGELKDNSGQVAIKGGNPGDSLWEISLTRVGGNESYKGTVDGQFLNRLAHLASDTLGSSGSRGIKPS